MPLVRRLAVAAAVAHAAASDGPSSSSFTDSSLWCAPDEIQRIQRALGVGLNATGVCASLVPRNRTNATANADFVASFESSSMNQSLFGDLCGKCGSIMSRWVILPDCKAPLGSTNSSRANGVNVHAFAARFDELCNRDTPMPPLITPPNRSSVLPHPTTTTTTTTTLPTTLPPTPATSSTTTRVVSYSVVAVGLFVGLFS
ncbi:Aste57867_16707 [Aphanomyces stellatus]|uniref:Aste57867_16707 protein n=1 Tax=Aphanomyces stellatus TaxID=120398 RepID=A0A485L6W9_9STRA|nr:hypothetical protein As57867_016650 [Aphanomyces stellatus]VFT93477.1 Aste57867_16707 [Aphanomyces stellatus]